MATGLKYYLRGLGTGIVVTALVLTLSFHFDKQNNTSKTDSGAAVLENQTGEKESGQQKEQSTKEQKPTKPQQTEQKSTKPQKTEPKSTKPQPTEPQTEEPESTEPESTEQEPTKPEQGETVMLTVQSGMTSDEVAAILEGLGAVESAADFNMYLYNNGYEARIRVGTFEIAKGADYAQIAAIITGNHENG